MDNQSLFFVLTGSLSLGVGTGFVMHRFDFSKLFFKSKIISQNPW